MRLLIESLKSFLSAGDIRVSRLSHTPRGVLLGQDLKRLFKNNRPRMILDVGANIGQTVQEFSGYFSSSCIHAFEPIEETFKTLSLNVKNSPQIHCHRLALGEADGETTMIVLSSSEWNRRVAPENFILGDRHETVPMLKLDTFCRERHIAEIDLLKTDCEGFDLQVLLGGSFLLANQQIRAVLVEVTFVHDKSHADFHEIDTYLFNFGYVFYALYDYSWNDHRYSYANALFVHKELWS